MSSGGCFRAALVLILSLLPAARAVVVNDNWLTATSGNWSVPANWSSGDYPHNDAVPTLYNATISAVGSPYTVTIVGSDAFTISTLTVNSSSATLNQSGSVLLAVGGSVQNGTLSQTGGTFENGGSFGVVGNYTLNSGTLKNDSTFIVTGSLNFSGGTISGNAYTISSGGRFNVGTTTSATLAAQINNSGTINFTAFSNVLLNGGTIANANYLNFQSRSTAGQNALGSTGLSQVINTGTFNVGGDGTLRIGAALQNNGGTILVNSGSFLLGLANATFTGNSTIAGAGTLELVNPHVVNTGVIDWSVANTNLDIGTLTSSGTINVGGTFNFNSGTLSGLGGYNVGSLSTFNVGSTTGSHYLSSRLANAGTFNIVAGSSLTINADGTFTNSGTVNLFGVGSLASVSPLYAFGSTSFINSGRINVSGGGTVNLNSLVNVGGTINVSATNAAIGFGTSTVTFSGSSTVAGDGTLMLNNPQVSNSSGTLTLAIADTRLDLGTFNPSGVVQIPAQFDFNGGTLAVATFNVQSGATFNVGSMGSGHYLNAVLNNSGTLNVLSGTSLTINSGATLTNNNTINLSGNGSLASANPIYASGSAALINNATINISGGGSVGLSALSNVGGTINVSQTNAVIGFGGSTVSFSGVSTIGGDGTLLMNNPQLGLSTGTLTLAIADTRLDLGTFNPSGVVQIPARFDFNGGTLAVATFNVQSGAMFNVGSVGSGHYLNSALNNAGTLTIAAGTSLTINSGGTLSNSGVVNLYGSGSMASSVPISGFGTGAFINTGTINVSGGGSIGLRNLVNNGGLINVIGSNAGIGFGGGTVALSGNSTIAGDGTLLMNNPTFGLSSGTLNLAIADTRLDSGSFNPAVAVQVPTRFDFNGGTLAVAVMNVQSGAVMNVGSTGSGHYLSTTLNNTGTLNVLAGSSLTVNSGGTLNNSNYVNLFGSGSMAASTPIYNLGTGAFINTGTINISGGGSVQFSSLNNVGGTINVSQSNAVLGFNTATANFSGLSTIAGDGTLMMNNPTFGLSSGTLNLAIANTRLDIGTFNFSAEVLIPARFDFNGGTLSTGTFNILAGGVMNVGSGSSGHYLNSTLNNLGTLNVLAGSSLTINSGGLLTNSGYANFLGSGSLASTTPIYNLGTGSFINTGTINISGGGSVQFSSLNDVGGTINVSQSYAALGFGTGSTNFSGFSTISGDGTLLMNNPIVASSSGTLNLAIADTRLDNGNFNPSAVVLIPARFDFNNGTLSGGTFDILNGGVMNVGSASSGHYLNSTLNNLGTLNVLANTSLTVNTGGSLNNQGYLNLSTGSTSFGVGIYNLSGKAFSNTGTVVATGGTTLFGNSSISNIGTLIVGSGTAILPMSIPQISNSTLAGGHWVVDDNATLLISPSATFTTNQATVVLDGPSSAFSAIDSLTQNAGTFSLLDGRTFTANASFTNTGTLLTDASSYFTFNGTFTNDGVVLGNVHSNGTVNLLSNGNTGAVIGTGALNVAPDSSPSATSVQEPTVAVGSNSTLNISAGGGTQGTSVVQTLDLSAQSSSVNLNDHDLIVSGSSSSLPGAARPLVGGASLSQITQFIKSGYNNGAWNGTGINSAQAHADPTHALGVALASTILGPSGGTFSGKSVAGDAVLIRYTWSGDANLDGVVNIADLGALATKYGQNGAWTDGDFNYDGVINIADLGALATNYGKGTTGPQISFIEALQEVGLGSVTLPEPALLLPAGLTVLFARRRTALRTPRTQRTSASAHRANGRSAA